MKPELLVEKNLLSVALLKFQTERIKKYTGTMDVHPKTEEKIQKLINLEKKSYFILVNTLSKRVACVIIATLLAITTTALSVEALRTPIFNFFVETFDNFSVVRFGSNGENFIKDLHEPEYLPEGYEKTHTEITKYAYLLTYKNGDSIIIYEQLLKNGPSLYVNTDGEVEEIKINGFDGIYYQNKDGNNLIFADETYSYLIYGDTSKEELVKIAESIEKIIKK